MSEKQQSDPQRAGGSPASGHQPAQQSAEQEKVRAMAEVQAEAEAKPKDETVPGGRYLAGDVLVDANNVPIEEKDPRKAERK